VSEATTALLRTNPASFVRNNTEPCGVEIAVIRARFTGARLAPLTDPVCSLATQFTRSGVLLAVLVAGQPAAAQTQPPSDAARAH
jgi:hypothetical protein